MKRYGYLFEQVITFENLLLATQKASQGKKDKLRVAHFLFHLEKEILTLQEELQTGHWQPSDYYIFEIREPKPRRISATDFRDRVVHHAICHLKDWCEKSKKKKPLIYQKLPFILSIDDILYHSPHIFIKLLK